MLGFREPGDIAAGVLKRGKLAGRVEAMRPKALPPNKLIGNTTSLRTQRRALNTAKTASDRSYDSEARAATLGGCWWWCFKDHSGNAILAPDSFANVNSSEFVKAKFELVRQLLGFESKLDTSTCTGEIVNGAMVNGGTLNQDPRRVISPCAL
jgi:hypothetical protein